MKKILSLLLALILVGSMTVSAFAAEFQVGVSETVIEAGEEVTVTITLDETLVPVETKGFRIIQGHLIYDPEILTYVSHEMAEAYKHYSSKDMPARKYFTFSYIEFNKEGFTEIPAGTVVTIVYRATEEIEASHLAASLSLELKTKEPGKDAVWYKNAATVVICKEHTWDAGKVTTEPTCTEAGEQVFTCTYEGCGATKTEPVDALGHTEETVPGKAATCTETGLTDGVKCTVCGETLTAQEEIAALGHTEETIPGKAATCTEPGQTDGVKCSVCGETLVEQKEIPAGHTEETVPGKAATCTESGLTGGVKCSVCGETLAAQKEIAALGHTEETIPGKAATCTESGLTDGVKCSVCGETLTAQEETAALGHTEETIPGKAATCTESGLTDGVKCSVCGETLVEQKEIPAGHTEETVPGKAATCTEPGQTDGVKCSVCGETLVEQKEIPAGHTEETVPGKAATCTESGLTDGVKCSVCGETLVEQEEIPAGHTEEIIPGKAATCTEPGLTDGVKCSACGEVLEEQKEIPNQGHDYEDGVCGKCGEVDPDYVKPEEPTVPSTPIKPSKPNWGSIFDKWFGHWWDKDEEKCEHTYTSVVTDPTCTQKGYTTHTCSKCGDSYKDSYVCATGHDYEHGVCGQCGAKDPNANKPGWCNWFNWFWPFFKK